MGTMRLIHLYLPEAEKLIRTAMEEGINFLDHEDIYGKGKCEEIFSEALPLLINPRGLNGLTFHEMYLKPLLMLLS